MSYQQSVAEFADCWGDNGALRPVSNCVSSSDFSDMTEATWAMTTAHTDIASTLATATGAQADALQSAKESVEHDIVAIDESTNYVQPSPPPAEPADLDGATVGTIVVASLVGVALVGGAIAVHLQL